MSGRGVAGCAALLALLSAGCFGGRSYLIGFPRVEGQDPGETADRMHRAVRKGEEKMLAIAREGSWPLWQQQGALKVVDAYVALGTDEIAPQTGMEPQGTRSRRKPLFLHPRATSPGLVEASRVSEDPSDGRREWVIPVLLHRNALERPPRSSWLLGEPLSRLLLGHPGHDIPLFGEESRRGLAEKLHVMLVARDRRYPGALSLARDPLRDVRSAGAEERKQEADVAQDEAMHVRADALEFLFRLPTEEIEGRWRAIQAAEPGSDLRREELFDVRAFPRIAVGLDGAGEPWRGVLEALAEGRWPVARDRLSGLIQKLAESRGPVRELGLTPASAEALHAALEARADDFHYFRPELDPVIRHAGRLADALDDDEDRETVVLLARDLLMAIAYFVENDPCPAPVLLDEPHPEDRSFSFIVGADLQYDTDGSNLFSFLTMFDPAVSPITSSAAAEIAQLPEGIRKEVYRAKFALIVGDFGDGKGLSSSGFVAVADALGLSPPSSPYADHWDKALGEFPELRAQIGKSSKPIFVVPGNHDGFVAYGGLLNELTAGIGYALECVPLVAPLGTFLENEAGDLPTIVRFVRLTPPFYDGLVDWVYELGPRNVAFNYRGCGFVAANSFDLHQVERDQVGALGNNWGGGLQDATLVWVDVALRHFANLGRSARGLDEPAVPGNSFLFMHHDPRGSIASKNGYREAYFGHYNDLTSPLNELTFGYFGFSWATITGVWLPLVSPIATGVLAAASYGENFQERWMRTTAWDTSCYNAKGLLEVVNRNLEGAPAIASSVDGTTYPSARLSHLFFGHDDTPVVGEWIQPESHTVFPEHTSDDGWDTFHNTFHGIWNRSQSQGPPSWASGMAFDDGRHAKVIRLDDLGDVFSKVNGHGFHLVTVKFPKDAPPGAKPEVSVAWIRIPR